VRHIWFAVAGLAAATGCGTDAVGVSECRAFERVRCQAAASCGYPDVAACERFERDHCLHGVDLESINSIELDACALDVERAGRCAAGQGPDTEASACSEPVVTVSAPRTACAIVLSPELASSCVFLVPGASALAPSPPMTLAPDGGA
jgi:hypothetical protein